MRLLKTVLVLVLIIISFKFGNTQDTEILRVQGSSVSFISNAPLEIIKAETSEMEGLINAIEGTFAFRIPMRSFKGFNSPLQLEHFHENYMESDKFRFATFQGRIIEDIDFTTPGKVQVRSKGRLNIHGIEQERIIQVEIEITETGILVTSQFVVPLSDHDISIPKIVEQKIAREISVKLEATFVADDSP